MAEMMMMMTNEEVIELIKEMSFEYKFNANDAIQKYIKKNKNNILTDERMDMNSDMDVVVKNVPSTDIKQTQNILMPFTGKVNEESCQAIRRNYDLFSQCSNKKSKGKEYCKTCQKNAEKNKTDKPPTGDIKDRLQVGLMDYMDPKTGKKVISYVQYLKRQKIPKEDALNEAKRLGIDIPDILMTEPNRKRGRVSKKDVRPNSNPNPNPYEEDKAEDKEIEKDNEKEIKEEDVQQSDTTLQEKGKCKGKDKNKDKSNVKKQTGESKRGRPKKERVVSNEYADYMEVVKSQEETDIKENDINEDTSYDKNTLMCQRIKYQGNEYLMTDDYQVYDKHTKEYLGKYNKGEKRVEFLENIESEEELED
jgi:hypothetical protein